MLRHADGTKAKVVLGDVDDLPVTGDWNGDKVTDLGVFDPGTATFTLRTVGADGLPVLTPVVFGISTDLPVTGDWDGNGDHRRRHLASLDRDLRAAGDASGGPHGRDRDRGEVRSQALTRPGRSRRGLRPARSAGQRGTARPSRWGAPVRGSLSENA